LKVLNRAKNACENSWFNIDVQLVEVNKPIRTDKEIIKKKVF
jgi:hypothetical protein